jgi:cold shock CspA family protein
MSEKADAARFIAKLLAKRRTPLEEVPGVMANVQRALSGLRTYREEVPLTSAPQPVEAKRAPRRTAPAPRKAKAVPPAATAPEPDREPEAKTLAPTLVRRAEAIHVAPAAPAPLFAPAASGGSVRGVVQWFDSRTGHGTLRLPGLSHDVPVDGATLAAFGIARLFKGQEIDATLEGTGDAPKIVALHLANAPTTAPISGGLVRDRHAKTVVVELKREALSRSAARAEAELLLRPRRAR